MTNPNLIEAVLDAAPGWANTLTDEEAADIAVAVERRVRETIATDIHAIRPAPPVADPSLQILDAAYEYAERIARGGAA